MTVSKDMTLTQTIFDDDSQELFLEVIAALGLTLNAIIVANEAPVGGFHLHAASIVLFGVGVIGICTIKATNFSAEAEVYRASSAVYGGIILALVSSTALGVLVAQGDFNNLLAILILASFGGFYAYIWHRTRFWDKSDIPFVN